MKELEYRENIQGLLAQIKKEEKMGEDMFYIEPSSTDKTFELKEKLKDIEYFVECAFSPGGSLITLITKLTFEQRVEKYKPKISPAIYIGN